MQNTETIIENINPEHFRNTTSDNPTSTAITTTTDTAENSERTSSKNFSFASTYATSHHNKFDNSSSLPVANYHFKPISSFTVLNNDDLASPFTEKPNAIVRPIRRTEQPALPKPPRGNDTNAHDIGQSQRQQPQQEQQLQQTGGVSVTQPVRNGQDMQGFAEQLRRKLRYLHTREAPATWIIPKNIARNVGKSLQHKGNNQEPLNKRPLFITTVPTGVFLPPAKEPLSLRQRVYAYSSHPIVLSGCNNNYNNYNSNKNSALSKGKLRRSTAPTDVVDNEFTPSISSINGVRGHSQPLTGGLQLTREQFQQQLHQHRAKRELPPEPYKNVMHDRRVVRGTNFGGTNLLADYDPFNKADEIRRRRALQRKATQVRNRRNVLGTPPPVAGRRHEVMQTDKYLEVIENRPAELSVDTQTDLFLERPPTPPYVPARIGVDVSTEIAEGDLFHFDAEAQPIIEILVDACIEQSILEVAHEKELEDLRKKQEEFLAAREAELATLRRLEAEETRLEAEKERRLRQDTITKELDLEMQKEITAAKLLQGHIAGLLPEVLEHMEPASDAVKKEKLMKTICPWLTMEVAEEVGQIVDSREILTVIIQEIIKQRAEIYGGYKDETPQLDDASLLPIGEEEGEEEPKSAECCDCSVESSCPSGV